MGLREYWEKLVGKFPDQIGSRLPVQGIETIDPNSSTEISEPAANTAASITFSAPGAGMRRVVTYISAFYTGGAPSAQQLTVASPGSTVRLRYPMGTTADAPKEPLNGGEIIGAVNAPVVITLPAAGVGVSGRLYASSRKVREQAV